MTSYTSPNGYKGLLYGESSLKVLDHWGKVVFNTQHSNVKNYTELVEFVNEFPKMRKGLLKLYEELSK